MVCLVPKRKPTINNKLCGYTRVRKKIDEQNERRELRIKETVIHVVRDESDVEEDDARVDGEVNSLPLRKCIFGPCRGSC
jgi:hypothetical protein